MKSYKKSVGQALLKENENYDLVVIFLSQLHPKLKGYITLATSISNDGAIIVPEYFSNDYDVQLTLHAIKQQISFIDTPSYQKNGVQCIHIFISNIYVYSFRRM